MCGQEWYCLFAQYPQKHLVKKFVFIISLLSIWGFFGNPSLKDCVSVIFNHYFVLRMSYNTAKHRIQPEILLLHGFSHDVYIIMKQKYLLSETNA